MDQEACQPASRPVILSTGQWANNPASWSMSQPDGRVGSKPTRPSDGQWISLQVSQLSPQPVDGTPATPAGQWTGLPGDQLDSKLGSGPTSSPAGQMSSLSVFQSVCQLDIGPAYQCSSQADSGQASGSASRPPYQRASLLVVSQPTNWPLDRLTSGPSSSPAGELDSHYGSWSVAGLPVGPPVGHYASQLDS